VSWSAAAADLLVKQELLLLLHLALPLQQP
jgi:hypothetical protein